MFGNKKGLEQELRKKGGTIAWATVISAKDRWDSSTNTGVSPMSTRVTEHMTVVLEVQPEGEPPFEAKFNQAFPGNMPLAGWQAKVIYDAGDRSKIAILDNEIFPPGANKTAPVITGGPAPADQSRTMRESLETERASGRLHQDAYDKALLRLSNLESLNGQGGISDSQFTKLMKAMPGVTVTTLFPTPDGLKQVVLKEDGTVVVSGAGSGPTSSPTSPASPADEIEKLANLRAKGLLTDAEFTAAKQKLLGV
jgi:hypothetical protein